MKWRPTPSLSRRNLRPRGEHFLSYIIQLVSAAFEYPTSSTKKLSSLDLIRFSGFQCPHSTMPLRGFALEIIGSGVKLADSALWFTSWEPHPRPWKLCWPHVQHLLSGDGNRVIGTTSKWDLLKMLSTVPRIYNSPMNIHHCYYIHEVPFVCYAPGGELGQLRKLILSIWSVPKRKGTTFPRNEKVLSRFAILFYLDNCKLCNALRIVGCFAQIIQTITSAFPLL